MSEAAPGLSPQDVLGIALEESRLAHAAAGERTISGMNAVAESLVGKGLTADLAPFLYAFYGQSEAPRIQPPAAAAGCRTIERNFGIARAGELFAPVPVASEELPWRVYAYAPELFSDRIAGPDSLRAESAVATGLMPRMPAQPGNTLAVF